MNRIRTALRRDEGASAVEYGLLVSLIAAVIVAAVFVLGGVTRGNIGSACSAWNTADKTSGSC